MPQIELIMRTYCPDPGCIYDVPADPDAHGWAEHNGLWWCPVHSYGEWLRLRRQEQELHYYEENIRFREQAVTEEKSRERSDREIARALRVPEASPEVARERQRFEARITRLTDEIAKLKGYRDDAVRNHERKNAKRQENFRQKSSSDEDFSE